MALIKPTFRPGVFTQEQTMELNKLLMDVFAYIEGINNTRGLTIQQQQEASVLFNGIVAPLVTNTNTLQQTNTIGLDGIPDLPTSKITSGRFPKERLPLHSLSADLATTGAPGIATGTITIVDDDGHSRNVLFV